MFLALRELRRSWRRFVLVALVVALVAVLSTVLTGLANGLVTDNISGLRALPLTHLAFSPGSDATFSRSTLGPKALHSWQQEAGVEASPIGVSFVNAASAGDGPSIDLALFGVAPDSFLYREAHNAPDREETGAGRPLHGLVLSHELQEEGVKVGDRYRLGGSGTSLPVIGFTFAGTYGHAPIAYTDLDIWRQSVFGSDAEGRYSAIALQLPSGFDIGAADRRAGTDTVSKAEAYQGSPGFTAETTTMTLIRSFLLVISALIVGAFFTILTIQRTRQIGLLKAIGASSAYVLRDGIGQITTVVVIATVAGTLIGAGIIALLGSGAVPVELAVGGMVRTALLLIVAGVAGSLFAFRRVTRVEPAIALGVES
ncbi:MAG: ABC transporter permease [Solirubrobacterales bacterium]|nr:ABC transporter permease [Solirubrobacterales bacterium]